MTQMANNCPTRMVDDYNDEDYYTEIDIVVARNELQNDDYHSYYYCCDFLNLDNYNPLSTTIDITSDRGSYETSPEAKPEPFAIAVNRAQQHSPQQQQYYPRTSIQENIKDHPKDNLTASQIIRRKSKYLNNHNNNNNNGKQIDRNTKNLSNVSSVYNEQTAAYQRSNYLKNALFSTSSHLRCNILKPLHSPLHHRHKTSSSPLKAAIRNFINCRLRYQLL